MPREFSRTRRVAELVQRELARLLEEEVRDPRIRLITITAVEVSKDLRHAKVYVTGMGEHAENVDHGQLLEVLKRAGGFLRRQLSHDLDLRRSPELHFVYDSSVEHGVALSHLIEEATHGDTKARSKD